MSQTANKRHYWRCQDSARVAPTHPVADLTLLLVASQPETSEED
jgi:hypothetical protein